ncbi:MAG: AMP-binding protein [Thermodesulfobacteriota bacterium]
MDNKRLKHALELRTMDSSNLADYQVKLLRDHIATAMQGPYYKALYEKKGLGPHSINSLRDIEKFPLTGRRELDNHPDGFQAVVSGEVVDLSLTSGTTGPPVRVPYTRGDLNRLAFNEAMAFWGAGVRANDTCLICVTLDRCFIAGLAYYGGLVELGATAIRSGTGQPARQWELIQSLKPTLLVGVPTFLLQVARWAEAHGHRPERSSVKRLVTIGEPIRRHDFSLTPLGDELSRAWQSPISVSYGATELETGMGECTLGAGAHIHPELSLVEIVDEKGNVLDDNQPGELVVTPLGVQGFPLVRFRTGDITRKFTSECGCGWLTDRIGPIEGRLSQRLKVKGTTIYPETIFHTLQEVAGVEASYVEVYSAYDLSDEIKVFVGSSEKLNTVEIAALLQARLRVRPEVILSSTKEAVSVMTADGGRKPRRFFDFRK